VILVVDDEAHVRAGVSAALRSAGFCGIVESGSGAAVPSLVRERGAGVVLLDLGLPDVSGIELITEINKSFPEVEIIIITGEDDIGTAVECMRRGAGDYIVKPFDRNRLAASVRRALEIAGLRRENSIIKDCFLADAGSAEAGAVSAGGILTVNPKILGLVRYCRAVAASSQSALITGETGVGKELFAKALHEFGGGKGNFVAVNVAGLDGNAFSDSLFGHLKGAFTGAAAARNGFVEEAAGGTLFLDEIGDLCMESQVKLLRLIQEREYMPLGSDTVRKSTARVVAATNRDLKDLVRRGLFRNDLYYRLNTYQIHIPPLRERMDDIGLLLGRFVSDAAAEMGKKTPRFPDELFALLGTYHFPGNIRELRSMACEAVARCKGGTVPLAPFREKMGLAKGPASDMSSVPAAAEGGETVETDADRVIFPKYRLPSLKEISAALIAEALRRSGGNQTIAASLLGITQQALSKRLLSIRRGGGGGDDGGAD
jgi:DNA-binding NtrC family response regulator